MAAFSNDLRRNSGTDRGAGQVSLEFYQKKKRWIGQEDIPWEVWTVRCELVHLVNEQERLRLQEKVGEMLSDKVKNSDFIEWVLLEAFLMALLGELLRSCLDVA